MDRETTGSDKQISNEGDQENRIMAVFATTHDAQKCKVHEPGICQCIDNLGNVEGSIIILD